MSIIGWSLFSPAIDHFVNYPGTLFKNKTRPSGARGGLRGVFFYPGKNFYYDQHTNLYSVRPVLSEGAQARELPSL
jgi:hypothetical protein